jgi:hypothetical protein
METYLHEKGEFGSGMNGGVGVKGVPGVILGVVGGLTMTGVGGLPPVVGGVGWYPPPRGGFDGVDGVGTLGGVPQFPPEGTDGVGL